ncbi:hypothetical protein BIV57_17950 [Mangrovactinospora gilvigrisea]|uniref:Major facilitator superfamily (MFS) profile domain-containing protein n=1 Tax=Mangrovactinospora gilvigrisea TaxID=1428644 RepID=A0A1J7BRP9_9ACTN|nr:MFS transporter [Mangrovactinospora gilvigrisea]OIV36121.1 hypothetical protein BIV57_17950 [Mangrovactinospora gilvigrisea]
MALAVLLGSTFIVVLNLFVTTAALPALAADLHANTAALEWVSAGYGLAFAAALIIAARLGDLLGRRVVFFWGLVAFTLASLACAAAPTVTVLNGARIAQGVAAALMGPQVLALMSAMFTGHARRRAFALQNTVVGAAGVSGQLVGGLLITADVAHLGWRLVFLVNVPVCLLALVPAWRCIPESRAADSGRGVDLTGAVLAASGLAGVVLALVQGRESGWPLWSFAVLGAALAALVIFVRHQGSRARRGRTPLLDLTVFDYRGFGAGLAGVGVLYAGSGVLSVVLSLYLQQVKGLSVLAAGGVFAFLNAGFLLMSFVQAKLTHRYGVVVAAFGALVLTAGYAVLAASGMVGGFGAWLVLAVGLVVAGAGQALVNGALTASVTASVDHRHTGAASGVLMTVQEAATPLGVAIFGLVYFAVWGGFVPTLLCLALSALVAALFARRHARQVGGADGGASVGVDGGASGSANGTGSTTTGRRRGSKYRYRGRHRRPRRHRR